MRFLTSAVVVTLFGLSMAHAQEQAIAPPVPLEEMVPTSALGYDVLQPGEIRAPELGFVAQTAMFRSSDKFVATAEERAVRDEADRLFKAGQGQAGVDYLLANMHRSTHGIVELRLANFYIKKGEGGLTVPQDDAYLWLSRAAEKVPFYWFHVGNGHYNGYWGSEADPAAAAHIWSQGVRYGCAQCGQAMGEFWSGQRKGVEVSMEDAYVYTIFALEMGEGFALWNRMTKILERLPSNPTGVLAEAAELKDKALSYSGALQVNYGGLAKATYEMYRTGLVSENVWLIDDMIETGDYAAAYNTLGNHSGSSGRYMAAQINKLFVRAESEAPGFFESAHVDWARTLALSGGDMSHAMAVGEIFLIGYDVKHKYGSDKTTRFDNDTRAVKMFEAADLSGYYDERIAAQLGPRLEEARGSIAMNAWHKCVNSWKSLNRNKFERQDVELKNGQKVRNMAHMDVCTKQLNAAYSASQKNRNYFQSIFNDYDQWRSALNQQETNRQKAAEEYYASRAARRNRNYSAVGSVGRGGPDAGSKRALSSARGWSNYRSVCSASNGTAHICD